MMNDLFNKAISDGTFPGAVLLVGNSKNIIFERAYGYISQEMKEKNK
jgi:hypothetical protein